MFFHQVLEAMRGKAQDAESGEVSWGDLVGHVRKYVPRRANEWFSARAEDSGGIDLQTPHQLTNLVARPVLAKFAVAASLPISQEIPGLTNSIGMKFALIPAGDFMMGSAQTPEEVVADDFRSDADDVKYFKREHPQHRVRITKPFYLGVHEVAVGQFRRFVTEKSYKTEAERGTGGFGHLNGKLDYHKELSWKKPGMKIESFRQPDDHPVLQVSWNDADEFCRWLSSKEGVNYSLPTEAEWEYACRAGTTTPFSFGRVLNGKQANCVGVIPYATTAKGPYLGRTTGVGTFGPNAFGLCDMHGNAAEWCADWFDEDYKNSSVTDPRGPSTGSGRVIRGGSWHYYARYCRSANRSRITPDYRYYDLGFRVLRSFLN